MRAIGLCPKDQCEWEKSLRRCHDKGVALSCSAYTVDGECPRDDGCEWKNGICWDVDEDPPCKSPSRGGIKFNLRTLVGVPPRRPFRSATDGCDTTSIDVHSGSVASHFMYADN